MASWFITEWILASFLLVGFNVWFHNMCVCGERQGVDFVLISTTGVNTLNISDPVLPTTLVREGNAITSICLSIWSHSFWNRQLTLNFCKWVGHYPSSQGIVGQRNRSRSRSRVRLMHLVWPWSRAVFSSCSYSRMPFLPTTRPTVSQQQQQQLKHWNQPQKSIHSTSQSWSTN